MDGFDLLASLASQAQKHPSGVALVDYCGVELRVEYKRGLVFVYHYPATGGRNELSTSQAINLLDDAYMEKTASWQTGLGARARQVLQRYGVFTKDELRRQLEVYGLDEWRARQNCGLRGYNEIKIHFESLQGVNHYEC